LKRKYNNNALSGDPKIGVSFNHAGVIKTGWIVKQLGSNKYRVSDGVVEDDCILAVTAEQAGSLPVGYCTIELTTEAGTTNIRKLMSRLIIAVDGTTLRWGFETPSAGKGKVATYLVNGGSLPAGAVLHIDFKNGTYQNAGGGIALTDLLVQDVDWGLWSPSSVVADTGVVITDGGSHYPTIASSYANPLLASGFTFLAKMTGDTAGGSDYGMIVDASDIDFANEKGFSVGFNFGDLIITNSVFVNGMGSAKTVTHLASIGDPALTATPGVYLLAGTMRNTTTNSTAMSANGSHILTQDATSVEPLSRLAISGFSNSSGEVIESITFYPILPDTDLRTMTSTNPIAKILEIDFRNTAHVIFGDYYLRDTDGSYYYNIDNKVIENNGAGTYYVTGSGMMVDSSNPAMSWKLMNPYRSWINDDVLITTQFTITRGDATNENITLSLTNGTDNHNVVINTSVGGSSISGATSSSITSPGAVSLVKVAILRTGSTFSVSVNGGAVVSVSPTSAQPFTDFVFGFSQDGTTGVMAMNLLTIKSTSGVTTVNLPSYS